MTAKLKDRAVHCKKCNGFLCHVTIDTEKQVPISELAAITKLCCPKCKHQNEWKRKE